MLLFVANRCLQIYTFQNIAFAAPPVGQLRFAKPAPPVLKEDLQKGDHGGTCFLTMTIIGPVGYINETTPNGSSAVNPWIGDMLVNYNVLPKLGGFPFSEDCLYLDVIVPGKALRKEAKLPIINYIYGGAYVTGLKDVLFDGSPLVKQSEGNVIYVIGNYRVSSDLMKESRLK
jgi:carboxylesterase type B